MYKVDFFFFFFPFLNFLKCSILKCVCLVCYLCVCVFIYILCQYACFEHNESIKVFFFSPSCLKNSSKKLVSAKNLLPQTPKQNREKRGICEERKKEKKNKTTLGSLSQSPNLSAGFQQDQGTTLPS